jgi:hypothetical protein
MEMVLKISKVHEEIEKNGGECERRKDEEEE